MKKILEISKIKIVKLEKQSRLVATIKADDDLYDMYFEVDQNFESYLTYEVYDAYLVCLLLYAMENNCDLHFDGNLTEKLYFNIVNYLMPAISKNIKNYNLIEIKCKKLVTYEFNPQHVGTGLSCGVDSFYTILKNLHHSKESGLCLDTCTFFNAGASGNDGIKSRKLFLDRANFASKVALDLRCEFITVDSNMNEFLQQDHEASHVFRTLSIPLALQKYFKHYYFSSAMEYSKFKFEYYDPAFYDILTMPLISTNNIEFQLVGGETTRIGKVKFISKYDIVRKNLNVCVSDNINNCGECHKCKRTMLNLHLINQLNEFKEVFDVNKFDINKKELYRWVIKNKNEIDMDELYYELRKRKFITIKDIIYVKIKTLFIKVLYKLKINVLLSKLKKLSNE